MTLGKTRGISTKVGYLVKMFLDVRDIQNQYYYFFSN